MRGHAKVEIKQREVKKQRGPLLGGTFQMRERGKCHPECSGNRVNYLLKKTLVRPATSSRHEGGKLSRLWFGEMEAKKLSGKKRGDSPPRIGSIARKGTQCSSVVQNEQEERSTVRGD